MQKSVRATERTCIACRCKGEQQQFIRYVVGPEKQIVVDYRHRLPGRGAYTCITRQCLQTALQRNSFTRAFRQAIAPTEPDVLLDAVAQAISQRVLGLLGIARKAGGVVTGTSMLQSVMPRGDISYLIVAKDAADGSIAKMTRLAEQEGVGWSRFSNQQTLGQIAGRDSRNCAGIKDKQFAELLALEINRLHQISGEI